MANLPTKSHLTSPATTEAQFQAAIGQLYDFLGQGFQSSGIETLTISSGVVTPTKGCFILSSEGGAGTDDLTNIMPVNVGEKIVLVKGLQTITLKHNQSGTGKLFLQGLIDVVLDNTNYTIALMYDSATDRWNEIWRSFGLICASNKALSQARAALGLGSAAYTPSTDYATAAQGAKADSALQPGDVSSGIEIVRTVFTTSGTFTKDANLLYVDVEVLAGGGGGGGASSTSGSKGGGGGTGGYGKKVISTASLGSTETVTIGAGGAAGTGTGGNGGKGGTSSFGSHITALGGVGGSGVTGNGGSGGTSSGGDINTRGNGGGVGFSGVGGNGGGGVFGGAGAGYYNGSGQAAAPNSGAGGGGGVSTGGSTERPGGAGGSGLIIVTEYRSVA